MDETFSAYRSQIEALRQSDSTFQEICCDYERLSHLLDGTTGEKQRVHIRSSLAGLEDEIRAYLQAMPGGGPDDQAR